MKRKQIVPIVAGVLVMLATAAGFSAALADPGPSQKEVESALQAQLDARLSVLLVELEQS